MKWNRGQEQALAKFEQWLPSDKKVPFVLRGYAGTGKSTITDQFLDMIGRDKNIVGMGPTGKSARVLNAKTRLPTSTIHKALYTPANDEINVLRNKLTELYENEDANSGEIEEIEERIDIIASEGSGLKFVLKSSSAEGKDFFLVDEASMVTEKIYNDLLSLGVPIILVGDPGQLPPVKARAGWDVLEPDAHLDEVMRTEGESSGINLAAEAIRLDRILEDGPGFTQHPRKTLGWTEYSEADIVLAGTHVVRKHMNRGIRKHLGRQADTLHLGDRLICLSNHPGFGLVNGMIFDVREILRDSNKITTARVLDDLGEEYILPFWKPTFQEDEVSTNKVPFSAVPATWANCITVHKSQGSEWSNVVVTDSWRGSDYDRWLYTAITRGSRQVDFVR